MKIEITLSKSELAQLGVNKHQLQSYIWGQIAAEPVNQSDNVDLKKVEYDVEVLLTN